MSKNWNLKNYEYIDGAIEILRNEICNMYGGSIYNE